MVIGMKS